MGSAWKNQWSVGNAIIDSEHRNLLGMAYNIESMIKTESLSAIAHELEQFEYWLCDHFENEEEIARAVDFDFTNNGLAHQNLLEEFHRMTDELMSYGNMLPGSTAKRYSHFLDEWLVVHILKEDMLMKPMLQAHAYDFIPDHKTKSEAPLKARTWNERFR
ncbi:MAG: hemerythrin domain-containing protein [Gallionella sp.]|nr:hemerythrin domain-containing protein [Gallionella sp.]